MADFSTWSRENLERFAADATAELLLAKTRAVREQPAPSPPPGRRDDGPLALRVRLPHSIDAGRVTFLLPAGEGGPALACFERELARIVREEGEAQALRHAEESEGLAAQNARLCGLLARVRKACTLPDAPHALRVIQGALREGGFGA